jgi:hypothetical protein
VGSGEKWLYFSYTYPMGHGCQLCLCIATWRLVTGTLGEIQGGKACACVWPVSCVVLLLWDWP